MFWFGFLIANTNWNTNGKMLFRIKGEMSRKRDFPFFKKWCSSLTLSCYMLKSTFAIRKPSIKVSRFLCCTFPCKMKVPSKFSRLKSKRSWQSLSKYHFISSFPTLSIFDFPHSDLLGHLCKKNYEKRSSILLIFHVDNVAEIAWHVQAIHRMSQAFQSSSKRKTWHFLKIETCATVDDAFAE